MFFWFSEDFLGGADYPFSIFDDSDGKAFPMKISGLDIPEVEVDGWDSAKCCFSAGCAAAAHHQVYVGDKLNC